MTFFPTDSSAGWANPCALDPGAYAPGFMLSRLARSSRSDMVGGEPTIKLPWKELAKVAFVGAPG